MWALDQLEPDERTYEDCDSSWAPDGAKSL